MLNSFFKYYSLSINPLSIIHFWWNLLFLDIIASVDIRPLPDAWVTELLGVILGVQDLWKKMKFPLKNIHTYGT